MRKSTLEEFQNKINEIHPKEKLQVISEYINRTSPITVKCLICNSEYTKNTCNFIDKRKVSICKKCFPTQKNTLKDDYIPPDDITLLEPYRGMHNKIKVKHSCGFCWEITPNNLNLGKSCPKCSKKISKGEQKIMNWLNEKGIEYIFQYSITIEGHPLRIDFYIPDYDLYIEYNGIQHYQSVDFFGGQKRFEKQQEYDSLKNNLLKEKLLNISYLDFDSIESILLLKFNDHPNIGVGSSESKRKPS
jgi:hypothetical protein